MSSIKKFLSRSRTVNSTGDDSPLLDSATRQRSQSDDLSQQETFDSGVSSFSEERSSTRSIPASVCEAGLPLEGVVPESPSSRRRGFRHGLRNRFRSGSPSLPNINSVRIPSFLGGKGFREDSILKKSGAGGPISIDVFLHHTRSHAESGRSDGSDTAFNSAGVCAAYASAFGIGGDHKTGDSLLEAAHNPTSMSECTTQGTDDGHSKGRSHDGITTVSARYNFGAIWGRTELKLPKPPGHRKTFLVPPEYQKPIESQAVPLGGPQPSQAVPLGGPQPTPNDYGGPKKHLSDFVAIRGDFKGDASQWHAVHGLAKAMADHACQRLASPDLDGKTFLNMVLYPFDQRSPARPEWCYSMPCTYGDAKYNPGRTEGWLEIEFKDWLNQMGIPASYT